MFKKLYVAVCAGLIGSYLLWNYMGWETASQARERVPTVRKKSRSNSRSRSRRGFGFYGGGYGFGK